MEAREWFVAARCECERSRRLPVLSSDTWSNDLSGDEREILIAGAHLGELRLRRESGLAFPRLVASDHPVFDCVGPFEMSGQWEALRSLCFRGALRASCDGVFTLSEGVEPLAKRLRATRLTHGVESN